MNYSTRLIRLPPSYKNWSLKFNVEKSCNFVFKNISKIKSTTLTLQSYPLKQLSKCAHLGVACVYNLRCTSDVEHSKSTLFNQHNLIYQKNSFIDSNR